MVTAQLMKWQSPVEMKLTASDLETIAGLLANEKVQEVFKDNYSMKTIAKQIVDQSRKVQDELYPSYNS
jgi:hypothetical protein